MGNPVVEYVDCYHDLANAIILQAVKDYKNALFRLDDNPNNRDARYPDCSSVKQMKESNKLYFNGTREELIKKGYDPCKKCNP